MVLEEASPSAEEDETTKTEDDFASTLASVLISQNSVLGPAMLQNTTSGSFFSAATSLTARFEDHSELLLGLVKPKDFILFFIFFGSYAYFFLI